MRRVGRASGRDLYILDLPGCDELPLPDVGSRFVCLLAWDARQATVDQLSAVVTWLLDAGVTYVCAWGPDCERVHDVIDEESVYRITVLSQDAFVMTTWHADEPLAEAIFFVLACAVPHDAHVEDARATIGIAIGAPNWAEEIREAFSNAGRFLQDHS